jgi:hypothetical protein
MPRATQVNPPIADDWAVAEKMQVDLATLFDIINRLDVENFSTPGNEFNWNGVQLKNLVDAADTQDAVTLAQLNAAIATSGHGTGTVTQHGDVHYEGNDRFNFDNSQGGTLVKSYTVNPDQKAALDAANAPTGANPLATMADIVPVSETSKIVAISSGTNLAGLVTITIVDSANIISVSDFPVYESGAIAFGNAGRFVFVVGTSTTKLCAKWIRGVGIGGVAPFIEKSWNADISRSSSWTTIDVFPGIIPFEVRHYSGAIELNFNGGGNFGSCIIEQFKNMNGI